MANFHHLSFEDMVLAIGDRTREKLTALTRQSAQDLVEAAQANCPVDTGFLKNSLTMTYDGTVPPPTGAGLSREQKMAALGTPNEGSVAETELGAVVTATWTANYSGAVEYGHGGVPPRFFVRGAVDTWPAIIETNARRLNGE